jgi:TPR repeat protein
LGNANAQYNLGRLFGLGNGVPFDLAESVRLTRLAAAQGEVAAAECLWRLAAALGDGVARQALAELSSARAYVAACCTGCGATRGKLKTCAKCKVARFCGPECVRKAWAEHKPHCKAWEAEAAR